MTNIQELRLKALKNINFPIDIIKTIVLDNFTEEINETSINDFIKNTKISLRQFFKFKLFFTDMIWYNITENSAAIVPKQAPILWNLGIKIIFIIKLTIAPNPTEKI